MNELAPPKFGMGASVRMKAYVVLVLMEEMGFTSDYSYIEDVPTISLNNKEDGLLGMCPIVDSMETLEKYYPNKKYVEIEIKDENS